MGKNTKKGKVKGHPASLHKVKITLSFPFLYRFSSGENTCPGLRCPQISNSVLPIWKKVFPHYLI